MDVVVKFSDGKQGSFPRGTTLLQAVQEIYPNAFRNFIAAKAFNRLVDLNMPVDVDTEVALLSAKDPEGQDVLWHSASHIMAQAVKETYSNVKLGIGPSIANGFYYDFQLTERLTSEDFPKLEAKIQEIIDADQSFQRRELSKLEAAETFKDLGEFFKVELIQDIPDDHVTSYENGGFIDLCRGPHVPSTGYVKYFKLLSVAGAYWRGDERNAVMQRIYGIAFQDKKQLKTHLLALAEAQKRDHRKVGRELDLFSFQGEGPGLPFWHPNGVILYNQVMDYMRGVLTQRNYDEIKTPVILNEDLWHRSGHWDNYKDNMYFTDIDEQHFALKPMNCPGGLLVYKNAPHSYRDLPLKLTEMGLVHRHEKSGVLHGLIRVREFTQDDAHVFCTPDQMEDEIIDLIDLVEEVYGAFGYTTYQVELSTRPAKSIGSDDMWERAEIALKNALAKREVQYQINQGEGAFYGPKIDYHIQDSIGRLWQCGTIQVDYSMPERFELEYVGPDGEKHRPVMLHRAILGSVERFIGILIEHYGGAFPVWLVPTQCVVIPISDRHHEYAGQIYQQMRDQHIRCRLDDRNEKVGYKIREAETRKIPYMCIIGDKEVEEQSLSIRRQKQGDLGSMTMTDLMDRIHKEIDRRADY